MLLILHYSTIEPFKYYEKVTIDHDFAPKRPMLTYKQETWKLDEPHQIPTFDMPMHTESGFIKIYLKDGIPLLHFMVNDPTGISAIYDGVVKDEQHVKTVNFISSQVISVGKPVSKLVRNWTFDLSVNPPTLRYTLDMEAVQQNLQSHLSATLIRRDVKIVNPADIVIYSKNPDYVIIDVRNPEELQKFGTISDAINYPMNQLLSEWDSNEPENKVPGIKSKKIILYCAKGRRSFKTGIKILSSGHNEIYSLNGGYFGYQDYIKKNNNNNQ